MQMQMCWMKPLLPYWCEAPPPKTCPAFQKLKLGSSFIVLYIDIPQQLSLSSQNSCTGRLAALTLGGAPFSLAATGMHVSHHGTFRQTFSSLLPFLLFQGALENAYQELYWSIVVWEKQPSNPVGEPASLSPSTSWTCRMQDQLIIPGHVLPVSGLQIPWRDRREFGGCGSDCRTCMPMYMRWLLIPMAPKHDGCHAERQRHCRRQLSGAEFGQTRVQRGDAARQLLSLWKRPGRAFELPTG